MLFALALLLTPSTSLERVSDLVSKRDVAALDAMLVRPTPAGGLSPFRLLQTNGTYGVGEKGWKALPLKSPSGASYIVLSTPMTMQDTGELVFKETAKGLVFVPESEDFGVRIRHHEFDISFETKEHKAFITDRITLENPSKSKGDFQMRISPIYQVAKILDGRGRQIPFVQSGGVLSLAKPELAETKLALVYSGVVNEPSYAGTVSEKEVLLTDDYWYPMVARKPSTYTLSMETQRGWTGIAQGDLTSVGEDGGNPVFHYQMNLPVTYFSASAGPFETASKTVNGKRYFVSSLHLTDEQMSVQCEYFADVMERFREWFGDFPFKGYGAVVSDVYGSGALEAYSYATYGTGWLPDQDAHEPSHTWWGGMIDNDYFGSLWNESFAEYSDVLFHRLGNKGDIEEADKAFLKVPSTSNLQNETSCEKSGVAWGPAGSSLGYGKGSYVLQMMEQLTSKGFMIRSMKEWAAKQPKGQPGNWEDYEKLVRSMSGNGLDEFFTQWLGSPGYPDFDLKNVRFENGELIYSIENRGKQFVFPLDVMLESASGERKFATLRFRQDLAGGELRLRMAPSDFKPVLVSFDPWRRLLHAHIGEGQGLEIGRMMGQMTPYQDPAHPEYGFPGMRKADPNEAAPSDPAGRLIIGHPDTLSMLAPLCQKVGFVVKGDTLTYKGTDIDLKHNGALALVDLADGKRCMIMLGHLRAKPMTGRARLAVVDELGRFLRGVTDPKTKGWGVFKL